MGDDRLRTIDIKLVKESLNVLLDHVIECGIESLPLDHGYYWQVGREDKFDMQKEPKEHLVGNLPDDLDFVERVLERREQATAYTLTELAPVLAYIGEMASAKLASKGG
jgi:hypothetical protein